MKYYFIHWRVQGGSPEEGMLEMSLEMRRGGRAVGTAGASRVSRRGMKAQCAQEIDRSLARAASESLGQEWQGMKLERWAEFR